MDKIPQDRLLLTIHPRIEPELTDRHTAIPKLLGAKLEERLRRMV